MISRRTPSIVSSRPGAPRSRRAAARTSAMTWACRQAEEQGRAGQGRQARGMPQTAAGMLRTGRSEGRAAAAGGPRRLFWWGKLRGYASASKRTSAVQQREVMPMKRRMSLCGHCAGKRMPLPPLPPGCRCSLSLPLLPLLVLPGACPGACAARSGRGPAAASQWHQQECSAHQLASIACRRGAPLRLPLPHATPFLTRVVQRQLVPL